MARRKKFELLNVIVFRQDIDVIVNAIHGLVAFCVYNDMTLR